MALDPEHEVSKDLSTIDTSPLPTHARGPSQIVAHGGYGGVGDETSSSEDDSSSAMSVSKQVELEAGHAIKYRTCSWQKVCLLDFSHRFHCDE